MNLTRISQASAEKLESLRRRAGVFGTFFGNQSLRAATICELGATGEFALFKELVHFALDSNREVRSAANRALTELVFRIPIAQLSEFDEKLRASLNHWNNYDGPWQKMQPESVATFSAPTDFGPLAIASIHSNGRVREAAIRRLAARTDGIELPFLLLRLNDWVEPIRELAHSLVSARLRREYATHFLRGIPLILRIQKGQRGQHDWLMDAIAGLFNERESASVLAAGLHSEDRVVRRTSLRIAAGGASAADALRFALNDLDPMIRLWAAKQLLANSDRVVATALHARLCLDPFMPIRRESLLALVACGAESANEAMIEALLDSHSSMREIARYHLKGTVDLRAFYRRAVADSAGATLGVAIRGLGECGIATDVEPIARFMNSPEIRIRKAAVAAIGRLAAESYSVELLELLGDSSPAVSAEAALALVPVVHDSVEKLSEFLMESGTPFIRKNALRLVVRLSKWQQIPLVLAAARDPVAAVAQPAKLAAGRWLARYNRSFAAPTAHQLAAVQQELSKCHAVLSPSFLREFEGLLSQLKN